MKEESSGSLLYILFIFMGVALISVGAFFYLTDDHVALKGLDKKEEEKQDEEVEIKEIDYKVEKVSFDEENSANIKLDDKDITLKVVKVSENVELLFNDNVIISLDNEGLIESYTTDKYLFVSSQSGGRMHNDLFIIDKDGNKLKDYHIDSLSDGLSLYTEYKDEKLNIYGTRIDENNLLYASNDSEGIDVCDLDSLNEKNINSTMTVFAEYSLKYYSNDEFKMTQNEESKQTLVEYQQNFCTGNKE